jgi:hypothetical protein
MFLCNLQKKCNLLQSLSVFLERLDHLLLAPTCSPLQGGENGTCHLGRIARLPTKIRCIVACN